MCAGSMLEQSGKRSPLILTCGNSLKLTCDYYPDSADFEFFAKYRFSEEQKHQYIEVLDHICAETNIPPLSKFKNEFEFSRAVWLLIWMHKWPKLQKFRYDLFIERFLKDS